MDLSSLSSDSVRRCHATILFADLCDSTRLAETCDPESLAEILYQVRAVAETVVSQYHGVVNQFYGDGVLAAFGFPVPQENDVLHATEAALALNKAIAELPLGRYLPKSFKLRLHTGVHAGLMVVQDGDRLQGQYKLYGDALNTAARLADAASENEVFASESTLRGVLPYFEVEKLQPLRLKGKGQLLPAYRVLRRSDVRTRFEASIRRGLSPFVGRGYELGELRERLQQSRHGRPQVVKVIGDAGLGKTRLIEEFLSSLDDSVNIYRAYCARDSGVPLQPFLQILRRCFQVEREVVSETAAQMIREHLRGLGAEVEGYRETYLKLLSLSTRGANDPMPPGQVVKAILALMREIARRQALVMFIDDWHWVDDLSRQVMGGLVRSVEDLPIEILLASRHEDVADRALGGTCFRLDPFSCDESRKAVASLFSGVVDLGIVESIYQRSGGNALFLEELCQSLRVDEAGSALERQLLADVPATLHGLIESRIDRLQPEQLELVRTAAVIGAVVSCQLLEQVLGYKIPKNLIIELSHQDVLYLTQEQDQLRFKHGLTRDVIYQSVTLRERQDIHRQVAEILQKLTDERGADEHFEALAYHYYHGDQRGPALQYAELAGDKALKTMALDHARMQYQVALEIMDEEGDGTRQRYERRNAIAQRLGWACVFDPSPEQIKVLQQEAMLAEQHNDTIGKARTQYWLGYLNYSLGRAAEGIPHCEQVLAAARQAGSKKLEIHSLATLAQCWAARTDYRQALQYFDEVARLRSRYRDVEEGPAATAYALASHAFVLADQGLFEQAQQQFEQAYVAGGNAEMTGSVSAMRSAAYIWQGRWQEAVDEALRAQESARRTTNKYVLVMGAALAAFAHWRLDGKRAHLDTLTEAVDWFNANGKMLFSSFPIGCAVESLVATGEYRLARHYAVRVLKRARQGDRLGEGATCRAIARLAVARGTPIAAVHRYLERALVSADVRSSRHEAAVTQLSQAQLLAGTDPLMARQLVKQAEEAFGAMQMSWHREQAETLIRQLDRNC